MRRCWLVWVSAAHQQTAGPAFNLISFPWDPPLMASSWMNGCISWMWLCVCMCDRKKERERQSVPTMSGQVNGEGAPISVHQMWRNVSPLWGWVSEQSWHATIDGGKKEREWGWSWPTSSCAAGKMQREGWNIVSVSSMRWVRGFVVPHFLSRWSMAFYSTTAPSLWANNSGQYSMQLFSF